MSQKFQTHRRSVFDAGNFLFYDEKLETTINCRYTTAKKKEDTGIMESVVNRFVAYCANQGIISEENIPWFKYSVERRFYTWIVMIPFLVLGFWLVGFWATISFLIGFYAIRRRSNGFHAKTPGRCFFLSLTFEALFLMVLYPNLTPLRALFVDICSMVLLVTLGPYNHPNCDFSEAELVGLKHALCRTLLLLSFITAIAAIIGRTEILYGLSSGIAMAAAMLCLAYIIKGGN